MIRGIVAVLRAIATFCAFCADVLGQTGQDVDPPTLITPARGRGVNVPASRQGAPGRTGAGGRMWYPLSLGNPAPDDPDDPVLQAQWILAFQSFLTLGELIGFSEHGMERIGITRPARAIFVKGLQRAGVLVVVPRSGTYYGTRPDGRPWHPQAVRRELRAGRLSLPHPVGVSPPPVWNAAVGQIGQGRIQPGRLADTKSTTKGTTK